MTSLAWGRGSPIRLSVPGLTANTWLSHTLGGGTAGSDGPTLAFSDAAFAPLPAVLEPEPLGGGSSGSAGRRGSRTGTAGGTTGAALARS